MNQETRSTGRKGSAQGTAKAPKSYDSMAAAAAAMGISQAILAQVKGMGAPGFRGSRVYPADLLPWLQENQDKITAENIGGKESWEIRKLQLQCDRISFENEIDRGKFTSNDELLTEMVRVFAAIKTDIEAIENLAPTLAGLPVHEVAKRIREGTREALQHLADCKWARHLK